MQGYIQANTVYDYGLKKDYKLLFEKNINSNNCINFNNINLFEYMYILIILIRAVFIFLNS